MDIVIVRIYNSSLAGFSQKRFQAAGVYDCEKKGLSQGKGKLSSVLSNILHNI